jgi:uncharacterized protein (DUF885 family)
MRTILSALAFSTLLTAMALVLVAHSSEPALSNSPHDFDKLVDEYFDFYFHFQPSAATEAGFHEYDDKLENFSRSNVDAEIRELNRLQAKFDQFPRAQLSQEAAGDFAFLDNSIKARLLDLENIQTWRRDPDFYPSSVANSIFVIIKRHFAPEEDRLRSAMARERQIPQALAAARQNLSNPPRVFTEVALEQLPDTIEFFRNDVPAAFSEVRDAKLLAEFKAVNRAAIESLTSYQAYLQKDLLPASKGDFRIGAENYRKKLLYEEMVDIPLDHLLEIGYTDLHQNQQRLKEVAAKIDPKRTPREVLSDLEKDHPAPSELLQTFRDKLAGLREFIEEKKIVTLPSQILPIVEESPSFERALTSASMDTPGAYEAKATEAFFNVTLPDPAWTPQHTEEWMESFNRGTISSTAIHEVYPGHYVQFLWTKQAPSKARKVLYSTSNAEGWAHYCEQMMLDEGYGEGDPRLRLGQLQDALLRDARFIAGIEMHTGKMTLEQAREFFIHEGYQVAPLAEVEAKRGTSDPTYLVYTLGKLQIMKLRQDYRKLKGARFSLLEFHDRFMEQGGVPLKIIRKAMLGDDGPTL